MISFAEAMKLLYEAGRVGDDKLKELVKWGKLTNLEYKAIVTAKKENEEVKG